MEALLHGDDLVPALGRGPACELDSGLVGFGPGVAEEDLSPAAEQLVEGEALKSRGINLESAWTPWKNVEETTLEAGRDFDQVVLGISLAALVRRKEFDPRQPFAGNRIPSSRLSAQAAFFNPYLTTAATPCHRSGWWTTPRISRCGWPSGSTLR